jgi:uncharacterized protein (TIGR02246 family)
MSADERAIRHLIATWMAASKAGDLETVLGLMADDVVFMVQGRAFGKEEFALAFGAMKGMDFDAKSEILEIDVCKNTAWCRTKLSVAMTAPGGAVKRRSGFTLSILRKTPEGKWVMTRDANLLAAD